MEGTATKPKPKGASSAKPKASDKTEAKKESNSKQDKAFAHLVDAAKILGNRVMFVSEIEQRNFTDHLEAASHSYVGNAKEAKLAEERIAERSPEEV